MKNPDVLYIIDNTVPYLVFDEQEDSYIILDDFVMQKDMTYELKMRIPDAVYRGVYMTNVTEPNHYSVGCSGAGDVNWITMSHSSSTYHAVKVVQESVVHIFKRTPTATYLDGEQVESTVEGTKDSLTLVLGLNQVSEIRLRNTFHFIGLNIYKDGVLIRKYVPHRDKYGIACVHDEIEGAYLYNSGTGSIGYERGVV
jgi:hypothetical protein